MVGMAQRARAAKLRALHTSGVLILPNAWDAASAAMIALAGAQAIATTSGGIAWSLGRPDGQHVTRDQMTQRIREIVAAVTIPVTADIEGGYGARPEDVALTCEAVIAAGAVGVNIEDSRAPGGPLSDPAEQAARILAARAAAASAGMPEFFINARTDVFLHEIGAPRARLDEVLGRCSAYARAGADGLFVPGLTDLRALGELTRASPLPVNVMAGPGAPPVGELAAAGVRRVSVGTALTQAACTFTKHAAATLLAAGSYAELGNALGFGAINGLFAPDPPGPGPGGSPMPRTWTCR